MPTRKYILTSKLLRRFSGESSNPYLSCGDSGVLPSNKIKHNGRTRSKNHQRSVGRGELPKHVKGGKTFASNGKVKLTWNGTEVICDICKSNNYTETVGAFGKSKVRSGVGQFVFGETADVLDTTSVLIYTCNNCGLCKVIRNKDPLRILSNPL